MESSTSSTFETIKQDMNLMFKQEEYVCNITDRESGPMAMSTIKKWDKREEGSCQVGDDLLVSSLPVHSLDEQSSTKSSTTTTTTTVELASLHTPGRPLVITFGSF